MVFCIESLFHLLSFHFYPIVWKMHNVHNIIYSQWSSLWSLVHKHHINMLIGTLELIWRNWLGNWSTNIMLTSSLMTISLLSTWELIWWIRIRECWTTRHNEPCESDMWVDCLWHTWAKQWLLLNVYRALSLEEMDSSNQTVKLDFHIRT